MYTARSFTGNICCLQYPTILSNTSQVYNVIVSQKPKTKGSIFILPNPSLRLPRINGASCQIRNNQVVA
uniref:Uncharacterized protein n=1 Tax=Solanum lycopersicum TaxID=4081 RepID=A0A3Q7G8L5_SOLLC